MQLLVLSDADVHALLGYTACVSAVREGLAGLTAGQAGQPLRTIARLAGVPGLMGLMPAYAASPAPGAPEPASPGPPGAYGLKAICVTPGNPAAGLDAHQGIVLLSDGPTGQPLAVLNASAVTEIRTAALYCDSREGLASESGDYRLAVAEGLAGPDDIRGTLGEVLAGAAGGRSADTEITVFESLGLAVEDLAAARAAYAAAIAAGAGQRVTF